MGLLELATVVRTFVDNRNGGPGQTVYAEATGLGKAELKAEIYGQAGVFSRPPKGTRELCSRLRGGEKIAIAFHNYQIVIDWTQEGETTIFSTTADGKTVKARIDLLADGNINLNGTSKYLVTWGALDLGIKAELTKIATAINAIVPGSYVPALDISTAKATTLRTDG